MLVELGSEKVQIGNDFYGTIFAPYSEVYIKKDVKFQGSIIARSITIDPGVTLEHAYFNPSKF